ncbi:hypothetical protein VNO78_22411 [Psophocarpus tetragonolobus]|uniref:Uncharacterized protein n=1 Tax=Psophocarpus tetragonolobus TaxID=3891 RepID=A0AAN9XIE9_PSOTE
MGYTSPGGATSERRFASLPLSLPPQNVALQCRRFYSHHFPLRHFMYIKERVWSLSFHLFLNLHSYLPSSVASDPPSGASLVVPSSYSHFQRNVVASNLYHKILAKWDASKLLWTVSCWDIEEDELSPDFFVLANLERRLARKFYSLGTWVNVLANLERRTKLMVCQYVAFPDVHVGGCCDLDLSGPGMIDAIPSGSHTQI